MDNRSLQTLASQSHPEFAVSVVTDPYRLRAWLRLEQHDPSVRLRPEHLYAIIAQAGIPVTQALTVRVAEGLSVFAGLPGAVTVLDLAEGVPPQPGRDGASVWEVQLCVSAPEPSDENDTSQFQVDPDAGRVKAGQPIVRLVPPAAGVPGCDVLGKELPAPRGRAVKLMAGENVRTGELGAALVAVTDGRVRLSGGWVSVEPVLDIQRSLFLPSDNVDCPGAVVIRGNVGDGCTVRSGSSVEVVGSVGAALIESGGDVVIDGAVSGKGKGAIRCRGSLTAHELSGLEVRVAGAVRVLKSIRRCDLEAGRDVIVLRDGIWASRVVCCGDVSSPQIGSLSETASSIEVGNDAGMLAQVSRLRQEFRELKKRRNATRFRLGVLVREPEKILQFAPMQRAQLARRLRRYHQLVVRCERMELEVEAVTAESRLLGQARVRVARHVWRGTDVRIARSTIRLHRDQRGPLEMRWVPGTHTVEIVRA